MKEADMKVDKKSMAFLDEADARSGTAHHEAISMPDAASVIPESLPNVLGQTQYIDDIPRPAGCLQAAVRLSDSAHARILAIHTEEALSLDPSVRVILAKDIPGTNQIGFNKPDEPLLPEEEWEYWG
ncbi:MAG: hypothetical protein ACOYVH_04990, partial [Spirochaetota bacterium]